jgi:hypothetical protein
VLSGIADAAPLDLLSDARRMGFRVACALKFLVRWRCFAPGLGSRHFTM